MFVFYLCLPHMHIHSTHAMQTLLVGSIALCSTSRKTKCMYTRTYCFRVSHPQHNLLFKETEMKGTAKSLPAHLITVYIFTVLSFTVLGFTLCCVCPVTVICYIRSVIGCWASHCPHCPCCGGAVLCAVTGVTQLLNNPLLMPASLLRLSLPHTHTPNNPTSLLRK